MHACSFSKHLQSVDDLMCVFFRPCTCLDWDKDGDILAITQENNGDFNLLHTHTCNSLQRNLSIKMPLNQKQQLCKQNTFSVSIVNYNNP